MKLIAYFIFFVIFFASASKLRIHGFLGVSELAIIFFSLYSVINFRSFFKMFLSENKNIYVSIIFILPVLIKGLRYVLGYDDGMWDRDTIAFSYMAIIFAVMIFLINSWDGQFFKIIFNSLAASIFIYSLLALLPKNDDLWYYQARFSGFSENPNQFAILLVSSFPLIMLCRQSTWIKYLLVLSLSVLCVFNGSDAALLSILVAFLVWWIFSQGQRWFIFSMGSAFVFFNILSRMILRFDRDGAVFSWQFLYQLLLGKQSGAAGSALNRMVIRSELNSLAFDSILKHPWLGEGNIGVFTSGKLWMEVHNLYLGMGQRFGFIYMFLLIIVNIYLARQLWLQGQIILLASFAAFTTYSMFHFTGRMTLYPILMAIFTYALSSKLPVQDWLAKKPQ